MQCAASSTAAGVAAARVRPTPACRDRDRARARARDRNNAHNAAARASASCAASNAALDVTAPSVVAPLRRDVVQPRRGVTARCASPSSGNAAPATDESTSAEAMLLGSLIPETLREMETDEDFKQAAARLKSEGQAALTREERARRRRALSGLDVPSFDQFVVREGARPLVREPTTILQVNIGLYCNQACSHCHVESSPLRTAEVMSAEVAERLVRLIDASDGGVKTLDITGGAPELMAQFRPLVTAARARGVEVIDRCNLTVLYEEGQEDLAQFLADNRVKVVASLPCYSEANTDEQRGRGVFQRSIQALRDLNAVGYGVEGTGLELDLMYNPGGAFLPPAQENLEVAYRSELGGAYGIQFSRLITLTNMPIKRFADYLHKEGKTEEYMKLLVESFNPAAAEGVMCRDLVSVSWDGKLFDCDFNQQLDMPMPVQTATTRKEKKQEGSEAAGEAEAGSGPKSSGGLTVFDVESLDELTGRRLAVDNHCFGCTAGAGSSCSGATA